jgi:hypothetical protein
MRITPFDAEAKPEDANDQRVNGGSRLFHGDQAGPNASMNSTFKQVSNST